MTSKEAFVVGFIHRCLEDGLSLADTRERVKQAEDVLGGLLSRLEKRALVGDVTRAATSVFNTALPLALMAPPLVGGLAGYAGARLTDVDDTDVGDIKQQELVDTYRLEAQKLRRQKAFREYNKARQQKVRGYYG